ncbi:MAG: deoxyhypusine synthase family protein [Candidatus Pacebacteria bacterium]|nr:deoxyhypusine synthase family protein [Candidatus Paceibacterota bacterium]
MVANGQRSPFQKTSKNATMLQEKLKLLSPGLQSKIKIGERDYAPDSSTPVTNYLVQHMRHCNGGKTVDSALWLRDHCDNGGKIFLTMSGAGSSFQQGTHISELIRSGKVAAISVTGANLEESLYRLIANSHYAYIPDYMELSREEEKELDNAGLRRITDTFLPEDESVRLVLPHLEKYWREAERTGNYLLWHEYFFKLFEDNVLTFDPTANPEDCWLLEAYKNKVHIVVGGIEDSTMGNIFAFYSYKGNHPFLSKHAEENPINPNVVLHSFKYLNVLAEWYMDNTKEKGLAFLQYGGGIAADFPICVVPHLKKDFLANFTNEQQEELIRSWAGFIEIHSSPMSFGSYSGAGYKEKITWGKFTTNAFGMQIFGDYTNIAPLIAAVVLRK